jgi:hypothetical protein
MLVQGPRCGRLWLPVDDELEGLEGNTACPFNPSPQT